MKLFLLQLLLLSVAVTVEASLVGAMCLSKKKWGMSRKSLRSTREIQLESRCAI